MKDRSSSCGRSLFLMMTLAVAVWGPLVSHAEAELSLPVTIVANPTQIAEPAVGASPQESTVTVTLDLGAAFTRPPSCFSLTAGDPPNSNCISQFADATVTVSMGGDARLNRDYSLTSSSAGVTINGNNVTITFTATTQVTTIARTFKIVAKNDDEVDRDRNAK